MSLKGVCLLENFWVGIILLLFSFAGMDRMMTGVVKPDIDRRTFVTYVLWFTLMNQTISWFLANMYYTQTPNPSYIIAGLIWITVSWTWIGGTLDFVYWLYAGRLPDWGDVLWWMPFKPKLWQWGIYAICWLIALAVAWNVLI